MKNTITLLLAASSAFICGSAFGALSITISPISGDATHYLLEASGTGSATSSTSSSGVLTLDAAVFEDTSESTDGTLSFGSEVVDTTATSSFNQYQFSISSALTSGGTYSFSGGSTIVSLSGTYETIFVPGSYAILVSDGIFGTSAAGTFEILSSPIPEPSTYAALFGLGAIALTVLRRRRHA